MAWPMASRIAVRNRGRKDQAQFIHSPLQSFVVLAKSFLFGPFLIGLFLHLFQLTPQFGYLDKHLALHRRLDIYLCDLLRSCPFG